MFQCARVDGHANIGKRSCRQIKTADIHIARADAAFPGAIAFAFFAWVLLFIVFMILVERFGLVRLERYLFRWRLEDQG